jgi:hypothetical protein
MAQTVYGAHGHVFTVECEPDGMAARVARALSTLRVDGQPTSSYRIQEPTANGRQRLLWQGEEVGVRFTPDALLLLLHWHVNQRVIDGAAARRTTLHAAAACSPGGHGIVLPAPMESGKTTTVTGLLRSGWSFLTDEAAGLDPDGTLHGYPKPLTIDSGSWTLFPDLRPADTARDAESWLVPATEIGATVRSTARLRLIVFPGYQPAGPTELTRLSVSESALQLAHSTFQFDRYGARDLATVARVARSVPAYRLSIRDLGEAVALINGLDADLEAAA